MEVNNRQIYLVFVESYPVKNKDDKKARKKSVEGSGYDPP